MIPQFGLICFCVLLCFNLFIISFGMDPSNVILNYWFPSQSLGLKLFLFLVRYFYILVPAYFLFSAIVGVLLAVCIQLYIAFQTFFHLYAWVNYCTALSEQLNHSIILVIISLRKSNLPSILTLLRIHTHCMLTETIANKAYFYFLPSLLFLGGLLLVFANYATVRMQTVIPMPYYMAMPMLSIIITVVILCLFPAAVEVHLNSTKFLKKMDTLVATHKYFSKLVKAQRPFRFNFGSLFMAKKSTQTRFLLCVFDTTIDAILLKRW